MNIIQCLGINIDHACRIGIAFDTGLQLCLRHPLQPKPIQQTKALQLPGIAHNLQELIQQVPANQHLLPGTFIDKACPPLLSIIYVIAFSEALATANMHRRYTGKPIFLACQKFLHNPIPTYIPLPYRHIGWPSLAPISKIRPGSFSARQEPAASI